MPKILIFTHTPFIGITLVYIYMNLRLEVDNWSLQLSWLECCTRIAGPQVRFLTEDLYSCIFRNCFWPGLINIYNSHSKFPSTKPFRLHQVIPHCFYKNNYSKIFYQEYIQLKVYSRQMGNLNSSFWIHYLCNKTSQSKPVNSVYLPGTITFSHLAVKK